MDGQRFDQLARTRAKGASRRRVLKGLAGGAMGGVCLGLRTHDAQAQCTWTGTFQTTFGGITMTLTETGGQVTGSYTFSDNGIPSSGTISGIVRTEFPGETILEGYWREAIEGGRLWFSMPLDSCAHFTGWYSSTDFAEEWISGWDGVRATAGGGVTVAGDGEVTIFANPDDSAVMSVTQGGQRATLFGPKDGEGLVEYISHALVDAPDGDPQKQVSLDFAPDGSLTRAAVASGDTMSFEWVSDTRVIVTYQSADGSQEVQFPFDPNEPVTDAMAVLAPVSAPPAVSDGGGRLFAAPGFVERISAVTAPDAALQAQPAAGESQGVLEVRCPGGALVQSVNVDGSYRRASDPPGQKFDLWFHRGPTRGVYTYTLPLKPAPLPLPPDDATAEKWANRLLFVIGGLCGLRTLGLLTGATTSAIICAKITVASGPFGGVSCALITASLHVICALNTALTAKNVFRWLDNYGNRIEVRAIATYTGRTGRQTAETTITAQIGQAIPHGLIVIQGDAGISWIVTEPWDPVPQNGYTIKVLTDCVPPGTQLTMQVVGTDNYAPAPTVVTLTESVTEGSLYVPGAEEGIKDTITATLTGPIYDSKTKDIVF
jgi:hypothetical protein